MKNSTSLTPEALQDCINLATGLFAPLTGFMKASDYRGVTDKMQLTSGEPWTIPISLDVDPETYRLSQHVPRLYLRYQDREIGFIEIADCYQVDIAADTIKVFNTGDLAHPGVAREHSRQPYRVGGKVVITEPQVQEGALTPEKTRNFFKAQGWKSVAGFQTRNPVHKAHEYLQRVALETCDGLFINPLVGWKKAGDFSETAVVNGYRAMLDEYYCGLRVHLDTLKTPMRYAGPREAIFHAIIRRNLGCSHFIIGRDHAGVGDYYGKYEAHDLARKLMAKHDLGITLLLLKEPFYCHKCEQIVSDNTCAHPHSERESISGTKIRAMLAQDQRPGERLMRKEVADAIISLKQHKFITE
ncbi:sulfate adenylyltransferase [Thalassomonas viridans]|uniref:Sulfate adenylyltransferase n=1 Tax=Thalassomonas viridans TaxID=137584 RepID=A0AAE9ZBH5_9GAMM|nr:sulfate adenylyltransferase [Thalassomonas viridans]WDE09249.1 sulfate adenylyltransferase [Thalassomonas viridans]